MLIFKFVYERNLLKLLQNQFNIIIKYPKIIKILINDVRKCGGVNKCFTRNIDIVHHNQQNKG